MRHLKAVLMALWVAVTFAWPTQESPSSNQASKSNPQSSPDNTSLIIALALGLGLTIWRARPMPPATSKSPPPAVKLSEVEQRRLAQKYFESHRYDKRLDDPNLERLLEADTEHCVLELVNESLISWALGFITNQVLTKWFPPPGQIKARDLPPGTDIRKVTGEYRQQCRSLLHQILELKRIQETAEAANEVGDQTTVQGPQSLELSSDHPRGRETYNSINRSSFKTYTHQNMRVPPLALHSGRFFPFRPFYVPSSGPVSIPY